MEKKNKQLIFSVTKKDLDITYFSGSGAGGQHRNRHKNCVRIKHRDSGVITTGQEERSLERNKRKAFLRLANHPDFKKWLKLKTNKVIYEGNKQIIEEWEMNEKVKKIVDEQMKEANLKIEYL